MLEGKQYLMGDKFTVADAYLYTVTRWAPRVEFDLSPFPNVKAFMERMNARPKVQEALKVGRVVVGLIRSAQVVPRHARACPGQRLMHVRNGKITTRVSS